MNSTKDIFTTESLIEWLQQQPRAKQYDYISVSTCALSQYFKAMGLSGVNVSPLGVAFDVGCDREFLTYPRVWDEAARGSDDLSSRWTFGEMHDRLEDLLKQVA